jgi:alcohol dehydrogenase class IV
MDRAQFAIPEMFFDRGGFDQAGQCALRLEVRKVFLVRDSGGETAGWVKHLENILKKVGIECVFSP